jgi:Ca2+-binding RTX toxin-like protein
MPNVTVAGAHSQVVTVPYYSAYNAMLAQQLANVITTGVTNGSIIPADNADGNPPVVPGGKTGEFVVSQPGMPTMLSSSYSALVVTASSATVFDGAPDGQTVLSGEGSLGLYISSGSGSVLAGGGNNLVSVSSDDSGSWLIYSDQGNDQILAYNASDTISAGLGTNKIMLGSGQYLITSTGNDQIFGGSGSETVAASGSGTDLITANSSKLFFTGGAGSATIYGGSGSDTFFGGSGSAYVVGGSAGNNFLYSGTGAATLFGGGSGDQLFANGAGQYIHAGAGNETLDGFGASGSNTLYAGPGADEITTGTAVDTVVAGTGTATISALGTPLFEFISGQAGGSDLVQNLTSVSQVNIHLQGYGGGEEAYALANQSTSSGSLIVNLTDGTTITFQNIDQKLTNSNFS